MKKILVAPITFLEETCFDSKFRGATNEELVEYYKAHENSQELLLLTIEELCAEINDFPDLNTWVDFNSSFVRPIEL